MVWSFGSGFEHPHGVLYYFTTITCDYGFCLQKKYRKNFLPFLYFLTHTFQPDEFGRDFFHLTVVLHPRPSTSTRIPQQESVPTQRTRL